MAYIKIIQPQEADAQLKAVYDDLMQKRGKLAEVHKIQSLHPESIVAHMDLYMLVMFGKSPLKRATREMMAVVVSKANNCTYCQTHHSSALNQYWKDESRVAQLRADYKDVLLTNTERLLCDMAWELTKNPQSKITEPMIEALKKEGIEDRAILDATLVISYFNFVNRLVLGLGVDLEENQGKGYKY